MDRYIIDIESDGLLDTVTEIHVVGWYNVETGESDATNDYDVMKALFSRTDIIIIGHNFIRYDKPLVKMILGITITCEIIDSLALSWYLYPNREKHGLGYFGTEFNIEKPVIEDWVGLTFDLYKNRVQEDVKINLKLYENQYEYLLVLYEGDHKAVARFIKYLMFKMECAAEQEEQKFRLDVVKCEANLELFTNEIGNKVAALTEIMPEHIIYAKKKRPKIMTKKDNSISKLGQNWIEILEELGLPEDTPEITLERSREPGNPNSHKQLKEWLFELGWVPITFKYEKEGQKTRKIPQVSLPRGQGICESVKELYKVEPKLEHLDYLYIIKHRIGLMKGFLRDQVDGFLQARIAGLTNTLRFKHSEVVNLPGYTGKGDWRDGVWVRGLFIANEGEKLVGSDVSSLEDKTKQHFMHYFDPEYVKAMNTKGFDPHLALGEFAYNMTDGVLGISPDSIQFYKDSDENNPYLGSDKKRYDLLKLDRHLFKTTNYGAVYGVGAATMSRVTGMPFSQCATLLKAYWGKNWSVKQIAKSCIIKTIGDQMWLFNPVSRFWYSLRYEKDKFSTLNQGTGVYVFDNWVNEIRSHKVKLCGQFHDEVIASTKQTNAVKNIMLDAMVTVNNRLKLNIYVEVDVQIGDNYAEIH